MNRYIYLALTIAALFIGATVFGYLTVKDLDFDSENPEKFIQDTANGEPSDILKSAFNDVDFNNTLVPYEKVLSGGVAKDGIPALSDPTFDPIGLSDTPAETLGILVEIDDQKRFYPYNILVSHEIVNDSIGETNFAVTFCPLCGSAIVFDRNVEGEVKEFGVSGFLFESNLIMYDRTDSPSLWSQARGEAIIGDQAGTKLDLIDFQLLALADARDNDPQTLILSKDTGFGRSYDFDPYSGYEDRDETLFEVSVQDKRFPAKEVFYIIQNEEQSVAVRIQGFEKGESVADRDLGITLSKNQNGELYVVTDDGRNLQGYYEMWFSWAQHHQDDGVVFSPE